MFICKCNLQFEDNIFHVSLNLLILEYLPYNSTCTSSTVDNYAHQQISGMITRSPSPGSP